MSNAIVYQMVMLFSIGTLWFDLDSGRIPNWYQLLSLFLIVLCNLLTKGTIQTLTDLAGALVVFAVGFPLFCLRQIGAGDIKAAIVVCAAAGLQATGRIVAWTFICASPLALGLMLLDGRKAKMHMTVPLFMSILMWTGGMI